MRPPLLPVGFETPALVVDMDVLETNLTEMQQLCDRAGVELVPHVKTHRVPELGLLQTALGAAGITVAKLGEAEGFANAGISRIILAYPLVGESKIARAYELSRRVDLTLAVDGHEQASAIGRYFADRHSTIGVFVIADSGMNRDGARISDVPALALTVSRAPGLRLQGILTHEGSVYRSPASGVAGASADIAVLMATLADDCRAQGVEIPTISLGSSASVRHVVTQEGIDQVRPGIYAFNDLGQVALGQVGIERCAATVVASVVSHPEPGRACIDAGSKMLSRDVVPAAGAERFPGFGHLLGVRGWKIDMLSEEHGWLRWDGPEEPDALHIGQQLSIVPNHICTVFASVDSVIALRRGIFESEWATLGRRSSQ